MDWALQRAGSPWTQLQPAPACSGFLGVITGVLLALCMLQPPRGVISPNGIASVSLTAIGSNRPSNNVTTQNTNTPLHDVLQEIDNTANVTASPSVAQTEPALGPSPELQEPSSADLEDASNRIQSHQCGRVFSEQLRTIPRPGRTRRRCSAEEHAAGMRNGSGAITATNGHFDLPLDCDIRYYQPGAACDLLERNHVVLIGVGDSLLRHALTGWWILVSGNMVHGAMRWWTLSKEARDGCRCNVSLIDHTDFGCRTSGMAYFDEAVDDYHVICPSWTRNRIIHDGSAQELPQSSLRDHLVRLRDAGEHAVVVLHQGNHIGMDVARLEANYAAYAALFDATGVAPVHRVFMTVHHQDDARKPPTQRMDRVLPYNERMRQLAAQQGGWMLETTSLTRNASSHDGTHYSVEVNVALAQLLFNYVDLVSSTAH